jgi:hypothetical protein
VAVLGRFSDHLACVELPEVGEASSQVDAVVTVPCQEFFSFL